MQVPANSSRDNRGFTIVELIVVIAILAVLCAMALPAFNDIRDRTRNALCVSQIRALEKIIYAYSVDNGGAYPPTRRLDKATNPVPNDPWGHPYVYVNLVTDPGLARPDPNTPHPLNDDFDLYSMGADGQSDPANGSDLDDLVRAGDGGFVGLASELQ